jgi:hypothetical protein
MSPDQKTECLVESIPEILSDNEATEVLAALLAANASDLSLDIEGDEEHDWEMIAEELLDL